MRGVVVLVLALVLVAGAVELYWDDDEEYGYTPIQYTYLAVLYLDSWGHDYPGDTDGQLGLVHGFRIMVVSFDNNYPPELYIFARDGDSPGECLAGPLGYTYYSGEYWYTLVLDEPVEVPGEFYAAILPAGETVLYADYEHDWSYNHSRYYDGYAWREFDRDIRIRVEWQPQEPGVETTSWGRVKGIW
ncbi:MAG: hypothetical protein NTW26_05045 [bacterium]|nr:hypothetical protein [bacterium]